MANESSADAVRARPLHPDPERRHAAEANKYQHELEYTVRILRWHWHIVFPDQRAAYEARNAVVDPGHLCIDDI